MRLKKLSDWELVELESLGQWLCIVAALASLLVYFAGPWLFAMTALALGGNRIVEREWKRKYRAQCEADERLLDELGAERWKS